MKTSRGARIDGFTFVELILVIAMVGLAAGLVAPTLMQTLHRWDLASDARVLAGWVRQAQQLAIATQREHMLELSNLYHVELFSRNETTKGLTREAIYPLRPSVRQSRGQPSLVFDSLGAPRGTMTITLIPRNGPSGMQVKLEVAPITGRVQLTVQR